MRLEYVFTIAAIGWAAALPVAAAAGAQVHAPASAPFLVVIVYAAGSVVCHQLPDRSFHLWLAPMPVCARCTGLYAGAAIAAAAQLFAMRPRRGRKRVCLPLPAAAVQRVLGLAALPTLATLAGEWTAWSTPSNALRALAAIPLGAAVAWVIASVLAEGAHGASVK